MWAVVTSAMGEYVRMSPVSVASVGGTQYFMLFLCKGMNDEENEHERKKEDASLSVYFGMMIGIMMKEDGRR